MTTPSASGLLRWGQRGRYTGWDDRVVITALSGRRTGIVAPIRPGYGPGLTILLDPGWLAVAPCGDGTNAVITSPVTLSIQAAPGGLDYREDEIRAEIIDPEAATWSISVLPEGASASGLVLGWVRVPPGAGAVADMVLVPREQDFSTGGAIPGPIGPPGPQGPPGTSTIIVGTFSNRTPADLLDEPLRSGLIPAGWDAPGNPAQDVEVEIGWSLIWAADGSMWTYVSATGVGGPWLSPGVVTGPPGERGPEGPPGPAGPPYTPPPLDPWHPMTPLAGGFTAGGAADFAPQYRLSGDRCWVEVIGAIVLPATGAYNSIDFFTFPLGYRPPRATSWPVAPHGGSPSADNTAGSPRTYITAGGDIQIVSFQGGINNSAFRLTGQFPVPNPDAPFIPQAAEDPEEEPGQQPGRRPRA